MDRLRRLIALRNHPDAADHEVIEQLEDELDRAEIVPPGSLPPGVISMHSVVRLKDLDTGEQIRYRLVFPGESFPGETCVSILAPLGTALIGYQAGDRIEWPVPRGIRRLQVLTVRHDPVPAVA
jgi:regulator of nucleoside diphosphate kinase